VPPPGSVTQAPPESLGAVGASVWKAIVKQGGPSMDGDALALERYCQLHDRRAVLLALVDDEGYIAPGSKKQPAAHPAIQLAHDIERQMTALEAVLALNPETDHDSSPPVSGQYQPLACQKALARAAVP
jgi:P27 family predicted phage terminase small subunit